MENIKNQQQTIELIYLKNYEKLKDIEQKLTQIKTTKTELIEQNKKVKQIINNFQESINFWITQNGKFEEKIVYCKKQIFQLKKQKINKIKNFFISFFSFGQINKNKKLNNLIEIEEKKWQELNQIKLENWKKNDNLNSELNGQNIEHINLINNINNILEQENKLLEDKVKLLNNKNKLLEDKYKLSITLLNAKKNQELEIAIMETDEKIVEQYESEIFKLIEEKCQLEHQISVINSDEGFNSTNISTNSLHSIEHPIPLKKQTPYQKRIPNKAKKSIRSWEETLREYDYDYQKPYQKKIQKNRL